MDKNNLLSLQMWYCCHYFKYITLQQ